MWSPTIGGSRPNCGRSAWCSVAVIDRDGATRQSHRLRGEPAVGQHQIGTVARSDRLRQCRESLDPIREMKLEHDVATFLVAVTGDPVALGLAVSLAHPGGNVTGIATFSTELAAKLLELLREIVPSARRIGVVNVSIGADANRALEDRAAALGVALRRLTFQTQIEAERVLSPAALGNVDGLVVPSSAPLARLSTTVVRLINAAGKPAVYAERDYIAAGGLALYGHDIDDAFRRSASVVDRVLKGANPADTPFEQPTRIALVVNLKAAKALGLTIPQSVLLRADELIQ
jgi:putative tryptophan/tyrosine transport system substrate-binding protein